MSLLKIGVFAIVSPPPPTAQPNGCKDLSLGNVNLCFPTDLLIICKPQSSHLTSVGLRCISKRKIFTPASAGLE